MNPVFMLIAFTFAMLSVLFGYVMSLDTVAAHNMTAEGGFIEFGSAFGYFLCAVLLMALGRKPFIVAHYYLLILLACLGMRELDFDKRFTTEGILKSKFLFSDYVPMTEKLIGGLVLVILLFCIFQLAKNHFIPFFRGLFSFCEKEIAIGCGFAFIVISKTIDGAARKLEPFGILLSEEAADIYSYVEEVMELGIPVMFMIAIFVYFKQKSMVNKGVL